jgi:hypothetical protein
LNYELLPYLSNWFDLWQFIVLYMIVNQMGFIDKTFNYVIIAFIVVNNLRLFSYINWLVNFSTLLQFFRIFLLFLLRDWGLFNGLRVFFLFLFSCSCQFLFIKFLFLSLNLFTIRFNSLLNFLVRFGALFLIAFQNIEAGFVSKLHHIIAGQSGCWFISELDSILLVILVNFDNFSGPK